MIQLPINFINTIKLVHKEKGDLWLHNFHRLIEECEERWQLQILQPFDLSYNFVAPAIRIDDTELVVKIVIPGKDFQAEVEALSLFAGRGMVKMLDVDLEKGILILERLYPGNTLATLDNDVEKTYIAANIAKKLWTHVPKSAYIPKISEREEQFWNIYNKHSNGFGPFSKEDLYHAVNTFSLLNRKKEKMFLLHGDFHHYNILNDGNNSWTAIDPKGLIGEREYDIIQFLLNSLPDENVLEVIDKRINIFVEVLKLDKERILLWGYAHAVLATCWSVEDNGQYNQAFLNGVKVFKDLHSEYFGKGNERLLDK